MFRRNFLYIAMLCGAVAIPYVATEYKQIAQAFSGSTNPGAGVYSSAPSAPPGGAYAYGGAATSGYPTGAAAMAAGTGAENTSAQLAPLPPLDQPVLTSTMMPIAPGPPMVDLAGALRFDVTAAWILGQWPRVTTCTPDEGLQGYRVALVSGTMEDDVAGSLTYYFSPRQKCKRITLQGSTGDARKIVALITRRFGLTRQTSADPGLYLYQTHWNGQPMCELHIRPAHVVRATEPNARFEVLMALNNPDAD